MSWEDFLRKTRERKLESIEILSSGAVRLSRTVEGVTTDTTQRIIDKHKQDIEQINRRLCT